MYNHYIPQSDGSYRRSTLPESGRRPQQRQAPPPPKQQPPPPPPKPEPLQEHPETPVCHTPPQQEEHRQSCANDGILSFLKGLLPRAIDSTDLLVIALLLLMNKDEEDDGLSPILTLALYFLL